jgi:hypothetical protein
MDLITAVIDSYFSLHEDAVIMSVFYSSSTNIMQVVTPAKSLDVGSSNLYDVKKHKKF